MWKDNGRRKSDIIPLWDVMHKYGPDYKLVLVGDVTMSPNHPARRFGRILQQGSRRGLDAPPSGHLPSTVWLNPEPERYWEYRHSISIMNEILGERMYPLSISGLERAMRQLSK